MNMSGVISQLIMQLGLYNIALPFKDNKTGEPIPTENVIHDVLTTTTIPIYSQFVPWKREGIFRVSDLQVVSEKDFTYMLPAILTITPVMYVINVSMPPRNNRGTFGDIAPAYGINRSVQGVATSQAYMMVAGQMRSEPTFKYLGYNKIQLFGFPKTYLNFEVACEHEPNGESIEEGCRDSFMELATLDVKQFLYNTLKMYDGIPTAFGTINLKLDDMSGAEEARNALLDKWRDTYHLDMDYSFTWM
jgi:hypothetical protein